MGMCLTTTRVRGAATGRAHRRCVAPPAYTLGLDIAGPFRAKGESSSEKGLRYLLVGACCHPRIDSAKDEDAPEEEDPEIEAEIDPF